MSSLPLPIAAFVAGLISFLSPCVLPLVPGYVSRYDEYEVDDFEVQVPYDHHAPAGHASGGEPPLRRGPLRGHTQHARGNQQSDDETDKYPPYRRGRRSDRCMEMSVGAGRSSGHLRRPRSPVPVGRDGRPVEGARLRSRRVLDEEDAAGGGREPRRTAECA